MTGMLLWRREDVERLMSYEKEIMWVKDDGSYLMVHKPGEWEDGEGNDVVYAYEGTGLLLKLPEGGPVDEIEWDLVYETTRSICGGDDFCEYLDPSTLPPPSPTSRSLMMQVTDDEFLLSWVDIEADAALKTRTIVGLPFLERMAIYAEENRKYMEQEASRGTTT